MIPARAVHHPTPQALTHTRQVARADLAEIFTGHALQKANAVVTRRIAAQRLPDSAEFGGGASNFRVLNIEAPSAHTRTVTMSADEWSVFGQVQGDQIALARAQGTITETATVVMTADGLRVSDYAWKFEPGSEP